MSPLDVFPPPDEAIDPDALEAVVASMQRQPTEPAGRLQFAYSGYAVTVTEDGAVSVVSHDGDDRCRRRWPRWSHPVPCDPVIFPRVFGFRSGC